MRPRLCVGWPHLQQGGRVIDRLVRRAKSGEGICYSRQLGCSRDRVGELALLVRFQNVILVATWSCHSVVYGELSPETHALAENWVGIYKEQQTPGDVDTTE